MRKLLLALALVLACAPRAAAQITPTYSFVAGTVINPDEVNANFALLGNALNRTGGTMTGTLTTLDLLPDGDGTRDLAATGTRYRDLWLGRNATIGGTLSVTGVTAFGSTLTVTGATSLSSTLGVTGATSLNSTLAVTGAATLSGGLSVTGTATATTFSGSGASLTSIPETAITDGTLLARVAGTETISGGWTFSTTPTVTAALTMSHATAPQIWLLENDQAVGSKVWSIFANGANLSIGINNGDDTLAVSDTEVMFDRFGNAILDGSVYESSRGFAMGATQTRSFSAGNYTGSGGGSWTVASGDMIGESWRVVGDTMFFTVAIATSTISGTVTTLQVAIPGGFTAAETTSVPGQVFDGAGPAVYSTACGVPDSGSLVNITHQNGAAFVTGTDNQQVRCQIAFKVS